MNLTELLDDPTLREDLTELLHANHADANATDQVLALFRGRIGVTDPDLTVAGEHKAVIRPALFAYLSETDSSLRCSRHDLTPTPEDTCCEAHWARWEMRRDVHLAMLQRRDEIANTLEALGEHAWQRDER